MDNRLGYASMDFLHAYKEIDYNINKVMRGSLDALSKKGALKEFDPKFFKIFQQAINELRGIARTPEEIRATKELSIDKLSIDLQELAAKVQEATGSILGLQDVRVPLLREPTMPSQSIAIGTPEVVAQNLHSLDAVCDSVRVKGDGHCLFRSIAAGFLMKYQDSLPLFKEKLETLRAQLGAAVDASLWDKAFQSLAPLESKAQSVEALMNEAEFSSIWMTLMRQLAAAKETEMSSDTQGNAAYVHDMPEKYRNDSAAYIAAIRDPAKEELGGQIETEALSRLIEPIYVLNTFKTGSKGVLEGHDLQQEKQDGIHVIFRPGHYDLALLRKVPRTTVRQEEGGALSPPRLEAPFEEPPVLQKRVEEEAPLGQVPSQEGTLAEEEELKVTSHQAKEIHEKESLPPESSPSTRSKTRQPPIIHNTRSHDEILRSGRHIPKK